MARYRPMRPREQQRLTWLIRRWVLAHGGHFADRTASGAGHGGTCLSPAEMVLPTICGPLHIHPYGDWIAGRFADVGCAAAHVGGNCVHGRLNRRRGKWNFHFPAVSAADAFARFEAEVLPLVQSREPSSAA